MTLETAIEENTAAIQELITQIGHLAALPTTYAEQKAKQAEPMVVSKPELTKVEVVKNPEVREMLRAKLISARQQDAAVATHTMKSLLSEYDVTSAKDLALEAIPNFIERFDHAIEKQLSQAAA
jgi:hypothetical protein